MIGKMMVALSVPLQTLMGIVKLVVLMKWLILLWTEVVVVVAAAAAVLIERFRGN